MEIILPLKNQYATAVFCEYDRRPCAAQAKNATGVEFRTH